MPAASMKARSPITSATSQSQVVRSRAISIRGRSAPPASEAVSGVVTLCLVAEVPPITSRSPAQLAASTRRSW